MRLACTLCSVLVPPSYWRDHLARQHNALAWAWSHEEIRDHYRVPPLYRTAGNEAPAPKPVIRVALSNEMERRHQV